MPPVSRQLEVGDVIEIGRPYLDLPAGTVLIVFDKRDSYDAWARPLPFVRHEYIGGYCFNKTSLNGRYSYDARIIAHVEV